MNNLSPIPFYSSLAEQSFRKWYANGELYKNPVDYEVLSPFFLAHPNTSATVSWVKVFKCCDEEALGRGEFNNSFSEAFNKTGGENPFGTIIQNHLYSFVSGSQKIFYYTAIGAFVIGLPRGFYYIQIHFSDNTNRYSELFYVHPDYSTQRGVEVKWYDAEDLEYNGGVIPYGNHSHSDYYGNRLYLDSEVGMPEYTYTEDGEERDGRFFPIKQISEKVYKFKCIIPEYVCDCLRTVGLSDVIKITDRDGVVYNAEHFEIDVNWLDGGYYAEVECTFETDTVVKKIGKNYGTITPR